MRQHLNKLEIHRHTYIFTDRHLAIRPLTTFWRAQYDQDSQNNHQDSQDNQDSHQVSQEIELSKQDMELYL